MALGKNLKRFKGENKIETTRELIVGAKIDQIDLFKLANYMSQSQISNKVKGFERKEKNEVKINKQNEEKTNALKDFLKKPNAKEQNRQNVDESVTNLNTLKEEENR